jgi:predicted nucleotide-binding protein (sugar kinase/HSP70/actin superfamily)
MGEKKPVIEDLLGMRRELIYDSYDPEVAGKATIGLPKGMYIWEQFPFWNEFFRSLGYRVLLSDETNSRIVRWGIESSVAEPCLPIQAYHGHVRQLLNEGVDWLFIPNMINAETPYPNVNSYYCPWGQTAPFVVRSAPSLAYGADKVICPPIRFRDGRKAVEKELAASLKPLGEKRYAVAAALDSAYAKQREFNSVLLEAGRNAMETLSKTNEIGIVLVGRVYNMYDRGMTLDIGNKLRDYYGVNVIPMDMLPVDEEDISDVNDNMYWNYGRKILAAAKIVGRHPNLHIIYLTNFKCGPDSYIKHFVMKASGKPYLTLQFDGHGNDAGYITRCEAYLDSKGALRWWAKAGKKAGYQAQGSDQIEERAV